jgi:olfactory receptor
MFFFVFFATVDSYLLASSQWHMMDMQQCVNPYIILPLWQKVSVLVWPLVPIFLAFWMLLYKYIFGLPFCGYNVINHLFCDIPAVRILACSDKHVNEMILILVSSFHIIFVFLVILISYLLIFLYILKMHSSEGYHKAFSTCASHVTAVFTFYGTVTIVYLKPSANHSIDTDKFVSVIYTMVIPMLNPMVYSLTNKEVKNALKNIFQKAKLYVYMLYVCSTLMISLIKYYSISHFFVLFLFCFVFIVVFFFQDRVSLCSLGCPGTHSVDQAGF